MRTITAIEEFNAFFHQSTRHPMVSVGDLSDADTALFSPTTYDMYCVLLVVSDRRDAAADGNLADSRQPQVGGAILTLKPGQDLTLDSPPGTRPRGWMLAFRPELLVKTGLGRDFYMFSFFDYQERAFLDLSPVERDILNHCFATIRAEIDTPDDRLTDHMIRLGIGQLLSYCKRFYERAPHAGHKPGGDIIKRLGAVIDNYLSSGLPEQKGQPTVAWCAQQLHLSANYFGDVVKRELHITAQEYVQGRIVDTARAMLASTEMPVTQIAQQLGFKYPNHFTRLFTRKVGLSPTDYRKIAKR